MAEIDRIRYYTDAHIPKSVVRQLSQRGVDILRCEDVDMKYAEDEAHLDYASTHRRVLVTADGDFLRLDARWKQSGRNHTGIIYISSEKQGMIGTIVNELHFLHEAVESGAATIEHDISNRVYFLT